MDCSPNLLRRSAEDQPRRDHFRPGKQCPLSVLYIFLPVDLPAELPLGAARSNLHNLPDLVRFVSWTSFCRNLATAVRCSPCAGFRYWSKERDGANLLGGVCAGQCKRCTGYDVAGMWRLVLEKSQCDNEVADLAREQMWTAFGIMLGYASGVVFHNVAGSGEGFRPTNDAGELVLRHDCLRGELLSLRCVRFSTLYTSNAVPG